jgi:hypothetical protein
MRESATIQRTGPREKYRKEEGVKVVSASLVAQSSQSSERGNGAHGHPEASLADLLGDLSDASALHRRLGCGGYQLGRDGRLSGGGS